MLAPWQAVMCLQPRKVLPLFLSVLMDRFPVNTRSHMETWRRELMKAWSSAVDHSNQLTSPEAAVQTEFHRYFKVSPPIAFAHDVGHAGEATYTP